MDAVKIWFTDFWPGFNPRANFLVDAISAEIPIQFDSDNPDFLFHSCFGSDHRKHDCVRIFFTGENLRPDFNLCDYAIGFDHLILEDRYIRYPLYLTEGNLVEDIACHRPAADGSTLAGRGFCTFIYSNGNADPIRDRFFHRLSEHRLVTSLGRHLRNDESFARVGDADWVTTKISVMRDYNFAIAFENSSTPGYTTEKILHAFAARCIPIYWGNPKAALDFNPRAFVNRHEFPDDESCVAHILELADDAPRMLEMLNEPVFAAANDPFAHRSALVQFLSHILLQNPQAARRRTRYGRMQIYEKQTAPRPKSWISRLNAKRKEIRK